MGLGLGGEGVDEAVGVVSEVRCDAVGVGLGGELVVGVVGEVEGLVGR